MRNSTKFKGFFLLTVIFLVISSTYGLDLIEMEPVATSQVPGGMIFSVFTSLALDQEGNIFCVSRKENIIVKFDKDLKYVKSFSRAGKGPGDIQIEYYSKGEDRLSIGDNGDVYFFDENPGRLVIFDNNGNYKKDINIQRDFMKYFRGIFKVKIVSGNYFTAYLYQQLNECEYVFFQLEPFSIKIKYPNNEIIVNFSYQDYVQIGISAFGYGPNMKFINDFEKIVFAESQRYRLYVYDLKGNKLFDIIEPHKKMGNFSDRELTKIGERFEKIKERKPVAYSKLLDEIRDKKNVIGDVKLCENHIIVFLVEDVSNVGKYPVDIYDSKGKLIKKGYFKMVPNLFWKDYAYSLNNDTNDNPIIYKYQIKGL